MTIGNQRAVFPVPEFGITTILCTLAEVGFLIYHITLAAGVVPVFLSYHWYNSCINFLKGPYGRVLIGAAVIGHHFLTNERDLSFQLTHTEAHVWKSFFFSLAFYQLTSHKQQTTSTTKYTMLRNRIKDCAEEAHGVRQSYNDAMERLALRHFLAHNRPFQVFWKSYFGIPEGCVGLIDDPLGQYKVDLGLVETEKRIIHGLIEVDVYNEWGNEFPKHYKKFHVLERKLKYFQDTDYPYLTCTFNRTHDQMCCTTRDNIERCLFYYGVVDLWMQKMQSYDRVVRCPLDENVHWFSLS